VTKLLNNETPIFLIFIIFSTIYLSKEDSSSYEEPINYQVFIIMFVLLMINQGLILAKLSF